MEVSKKRRLQSSEDVEQLDNFAIENQQMLAMIERLGALTTETDQLGVLPTSFDELYSTINDLPTILEKLKKRMDFAKMRTRLDPNNIQSIKQYGVNPIYLTEKLTIGGKKSKDWSEQIKNAEKSRIVKWTVGDVNFEGDFYPGLVVNGNAYLGCSGVSGRPDLFECPFAPVCSYASNSTRDVNDHLRIHFNRPIFFCFKCRGVFGNLSNFKVHMKCCSPYLTDKTEIDTFILICKEKSLEYADFQKVAIQLCTLRKVNLGVLGWVEEKQELFSKHFEFIINLPSLNSQEPRILSMNQEFGDRLNNLCALSKYGNEAELYAVFETTEQLNEDNATMHGKYAGSQCTIHYKKRNESRHRYFIEDVHRTSATFHNEIRFAKAEDPPRSFKIVKFLSGIRSDYFDQESNLWNRARHTLEDALKTMFEALSINLSNIKAVSRNELNDTYMWPTEKRMLLGLFIYRRQWDAIRTGLNDPQNVI